MLSAGERHWQSQWHTTRILCRDKTLAALLNSFLLPSHFPFAGEVGLKVVLAMTFRLPLIGVLLCGVLAAGCQRTARDLKLSQPTAREACTTFLTAWKEGKKADELKPKIYGRDQSWDDGQKLIDFELLAEEKTDGVTLFVPARLTLQDAKGKESKSTVTYAVATDPVITVIRD